MQKLCDISKYNVVRYSLKNDGKCLGDWDVDLPFKIDVDATKLSDIWALFLFQGDRDVVLHDLSVAFEWCHDAYVNLFKENWDQPDNWVISPLIGNGMPRDTDPEAIKKAQQLVQMYNIVLYEIYEKLLEVPKKLEINFID